MIATANSFPQLYANIKLSTITRVNPDLVALGEIGLSGELRAVSQLDKRLAEAAKLGFKACLPPPVQSGQKPPSGIEPVTVSSLSQALKLGLEQE